MNPVSILKLGVSNCFGIKSKVYLFILLFLKLQTLTAQNLEYVYYNIKVTNKVYGSFVYDGDTINILEKKSAGKYIDSLKLNKLSEKIDYYFILPDSLPDGKYGVFYNDKKKNLAFVVKYKNNKRNGSFLYFHYNKKVKKAGFYKDNCFDKILVEYNKFGQSVGISNYSNCELNGAYVRFSSTGEFHFICNFKNGKKDGEFIMYKYFDRKAKRDKKFPLLYQHLEYNQDTMIKDYLKP